MYMYMYCIFNFEFYVFSLCLKGDYVRLWVPELKNVSGGEVHTVWTLSSNTLSKTGVSLGETYPNPIVVAPEWSRHYGKSVSKLCKLE